MTIPPKRASRLFFMLLALCALLLPLASAQVLAQNLNFTAGVKSPTDSMGSTPSLARFNGKLYAAFRSNDTRNVLYVASSTDGINFAPAQAYPQFQMGSAPSLAVFNNRLYVGFQANDSDHALYVTSSGDGVNFTQASGKFNVQIGSAPSLAAFDGRLFVAFKANDAGNAVWVANSTDGNRFASTYYGNLMQTGVSPALAAFNGRLYLAQRANDNSNILYVTSSSDGFGFATPTGYSGIAMGSAPALAAANGALYVAFKSNDSRNILWVTASNSGGNFPSTPGVDQVRLSGQPAIAGFGSGVSIAFRANDAGNAFFATHNGNVVAQTKSAKRGIAYNLEAAGDLQALSPGVSWWYNWSPQPASSVRPDYRVAYGMDYIPTLWNDNFDAAGVEAFIKANPQIKYMLVLNEPNLVEQANVTPQQAAAFWPRYEAVAAHTGVKIVGPQITYGTMPGYGDPMQWLDAFYAAYRGANGGRDPRIDYLGFHWYDYGLSDQLDRLKKYGKPFWVTEMANWHSQSDGAQIDSVDKQKAQMKDMVAICEGRSDVFRYAWFTGRWPNDVHYTSLLGPTGQLTDLGRYYLSLPY